ncbi:putative hydroxymethylpyrimidine transporter CytX [Candidatus Caldatribacterium sp.]|uniref:putative hydroxymethylpyrimidine transporter CytX n=1 Tax=Candidatus Caldatribacterium sp. TaxID=2282143 RepID=UPI00299B1A1F|nr:putative hydroxymethylpyrimidine transporter CytX [Candidatus Caldatribacterium sp.]MDW8080410.1 putative hydroxymethylpyrimidine transporter CytX [Candidatus Calescibacterium sp.]
MLESLRPVPEERRHLSGFDLFLLWVGAAVAVSEIWAGSILAPLGFVGGMSAILLGHLVGNTPFALGGVLGSDFGVPAMVSVRLAFGKWGSYLASFLNILQLIGWTAVMVIICAKAGDGIVQSLFGFSSFRLLLVVAGVVSTFWALLETSWWQWMQRVAVLALSALSGVMTFVALRGVSFAELLRLRGDGSLPWGAGFDLVVAMPISWLPLVADYTRFARNTKGAFWGTWWGYFIASSWMYAVGLVSALTTGQADPLPAMVALRLGLVALLIVLFSTFTTTFLDIYSASVSFLNVYPRAKEKLATVLFGASGTLLALVFPMDKYESFLFLIGAVFTPLFGVVIADYFFLRRRKATIEEFYDHCPRIVWEAVVSWAFGVGVYVLFLKLFPAFGASIPSFLFPGGLYLLLRRRK